MGEKKEVLLISGLIFLFSFVVILASSPVIEFVDPTPSLNVSGNSVYANLSSSDSDEHYSFIDFDSDLIFWMRMDDVDGSGNPVDLSSYGNNGDLVGTAVINSSSGYFGNGSWFDGDSDKIVVPDDNILDSPGVMDRITVCAWMNINNHQTGFIGLVGKWKIDERQYLLTKDTTTNKYGLILSRDGQTHTTSGGDVFTNSELNTGQWYHLCGTYDNSTMHVYLDGVQQTDTQDSQGINDVGTGNLEIGTFYNSFTYAFDGMIDEVMIWNRDLSLVEINSLYNASANQYEHNFTNLNQGEHTLTGYGVSKDGSLSSVSRIISTGFSEESNNSYVSIILNSPENNSNNFLPLLVNMSLESSEDSYSFIDFDSDLIFWMRMDDEDLGTLADRSSYANDGTLEDEAVTSADGIFGRALVVNDSGYVNVLDDDSLDSPGVTDEITVCAWFNPAQHGTDFTGIVGKYNTLTDGNDRQYLMARNNVNNKYGFFLSSAGTTFDATVLTNSELNTGQWYQLCGTSDGTVKLYLDGVQQSATETLAGGIKDDTIANLTIGKFPRANGEFNGSIDEVLIFKRALSSTEIQSLYNSGIYKYEHNFTSLSIGTHTFTGYVVNQSASYLSTTRTISTNSSSSSNSTPVLVLNCNTNYENFFNIEYIINTTNNPDNCSFSRDGAGNVSMVPVGGGIFSSSESLDAGIYNLTFSCTNSNGTGSLSNLFTLRKSKVAEHTYFTNSEGLDIYFDFYFNSTSEDGPLLVVPDSWTSTKDSYREPVMTAFRDEGYSILLVDTRGKGDSEGSRGAFGYECIDIYEAVQMVKANSNYNDYIGNNIHIWGFSAGGGRAGVCSARYPDLFSSIFSTGGVLNVTRWYYLDPGYQTDLETRIGGTPVSNPEGYTARDASYLNYNSLAPSMVTAYQGDASVHVNLSRDYNLSMNNNGKTIRYDEYAGGSHAIVGLDDSVDYFANHTDIYFIPSSGNFIVSGFLFTKNFSINWGNAGKTGNVTYNISGSGKTFNISTLSYSGRVNITLYNLQASTEYAINFSGSTSYNTSSSSGNLTFSVNLINSSENYLTISPSSGYCGDSVCNNGESCSTCPADCGVCSSSSSSSSGSSSGGGGSGSSGMAIASLKKLTLEKISDLIANPGDIKKLILSSKNEDLSFLNNCKFNGKGEYASWLTSSEGVKNLASGEAYDFSFNLNIPDDAKIFRYPLKASIECEETSQSIEFFAEIVEKKFNFELIKVKKDEQGNLNILYLLSELSGTEQIVEIQFLLFNPEGGEISEFLENKSISANSNEEFESIIPINSYSGEEFRLLINLNSEEYSTFVQENVVVGTPISGFAVSSLVMNKDVFLSIFFILLFLIFTFFAIRKIVKNRRKSS